MAEALSNVGEAISLHGVEAWFKHTDSNYATQKQSLHDGFPSYPLPRRRWKKNLELLRVTSGELKRGDQDFAQWCLSVKPDQQAIRLTEDQSGVPRLLVLPCQLQQAQGDNLIEDYSVDGLTEDIVAGLSSSRWLSVYDLGTSLSFEHDQAPPAELARNIGADYVLHGRIRKTHTQLKVSYFLVDVRTQAVVTSKQFRGATSELMWLEDQITRHVIGSIEPDYLNHQSAIIERRPTNFREWELLMKARHLFWKTTQETTSAARGLLLEPLEVNRDNARVWGMLAMTHLNDIWLGWAESVTDSMQLADDCSLKAIKLDDSDPWAHHTRSAYAGSAKQYEMAEAHLQRALHLNPDFVAALGDLTRIRVFADKAQGASIYAKKAISISPRDPHLALWYYWIALGEFSDEHFEQAIPWLNKSIAARPDWNTAILLKAICLTHSNQREQAQLLTANLKAMSFNSIVEALPQSHPFVNEAVRQRYISGLLRSGLNPQLHKVADNKKVGSDET